MSQTESRAPTPAVTRVHPLIEFSTNGLYPYWNLQKSGFHPYLDAVRRAFSGINPFSHQQIPTSERIGLNIKYGRKYFREQPYPNPSHFDSKYPSHYDPLNDERFTAKPNVQHVQGQLTIKAKPTVPRFCEREIRKYKTCVVANDNNQEVCQQEQSNIIAICPQWALNNLKEKKLGLIKLEALNNKRYREAIAVSSYNQGRTVADVPLRRWEDGSREHLRPNTLWADDRYVDITSDEVKAAKIRVQQRRKVNPTPNRAQLPHYDRTYEVPPQQIPLYPLE